MSKYTDDSVVVAMSGGVDSSVAALLAAREGRARAAFTMRLSDSAVPAGDGRCCAVGDIRDARRVAARIGLAHYVVDLRERFDRDVIRPFVEAYASGQTPIPCVACNDRLKFRDLADRARSLGASRVATGHYARLERDGRHVRLLRARDRSKDQSYFLHGLSQDQLRAADFPLGDLLKPQVRELAREAGLDTADKPESQEICFVPDGDAAGFVERQAGRLGLELRPGTLVDAAGGERGAHGGVHRYTVGQRKGLGAHGEPVYVLELRAGRAEVVVGRADEVMFDEAHVESFNWIAGADQGSTDVDVQVRHASRAIRARITPRGRGALVRFEQPVRAVSPGQALVAWHDDVVVGGGSITSAKRTALPLAAAR